MTSVIEVKNVSKRFGATRAVDNVSLTVPPGCVFALLGENGAGKTTLIKMLLGLLKPDQGELRVLGQDSTRDSEAIRRQVGYVPERPVLYEWMTAAEIGWFTAGFYGDGFETNYRLLIDRFRVPPERKISQMSKGTRSKVVLSLAMAHNPALLVLDEPTSGLDTLVRREYMESMVDQAARGNTVLLSSHQIPEVERVADWVAIFREGHLLEVAPLEAIKSNTREWTVTMEGFAAVEPTTGGRVLTSERDARQWRLLARHDDLDEQEAASRLMATDGVVAVDFRTPSLEEIFVAYMRQGESTGEAAAATHPSPLHTA